MNSQFFSFTGNLNQWHKCHMSLESAPVRYDKLSHYDQECYLGNIIRNIASTHDISISLLVFELHADKRLHSHGIFFGKSENITLFKKQYMAFQQFKKQNYEDHHSLYVQCDILYTVKDYDTFMKYCLKDQCLMNTYLLESKCSEAPISRGEINPAGLGVKLNP